MISSINNISLETKRYVLRACFPYAIIIVNEPSNQKLCSYCAAHANVSFYLSQFNAWIWMKFGYNICHFGNYSYCGLSFMLIIGIIIVMISSALCAQSLLLGKNHFYSPNLGFSNTKVEYTDIFIFIAIEFYSYSPIDREWVHWAAEEIARSPPPPPQSCI